MQQRQQQRQQQQQQSTDQEGTTLREDNLRDLNLGKMTYQSETLPQEKDSTSGLDNKGPTGGRTIKTPEKPSGSAGNPNTVTRTLKTKRFRAHYPAKKLKRKIGFVVPTHSTTSIRSTESIREKPLKSVLRSTSGSIRSSTSSVRFVLPVDGVDENGRRRSLGSYRAEAREIYRNRIEGCRTIVRMHRCRLAMCILYGILVPFFIIIPVFLLYWEPETNRSVQG